MEALRAGILLNERVSALIEKVDRMDQDLRKVNERLIRVETVLAISKMRPPQIE
jgi:hypothetical protein